MQTNFLLGALLLTEPARLALKRQPYDLICRHAIGDHGNINQAERGMNEQSLKTLGPILSRYRVDPTDPDSSTVIILTKETWCETLIALE